MVIVCERGMCAQIVGIQRGGMPRRPLNTSFDLSLNVDWHVWLGIPHDIIMGSARHQTADVLLAIRLVGSRQIQD